MECVPIKHWLNQVPTQVDETAHKSGKPQTLSACGNHELALMQRKPKLEYHCSIKKVMKKKLMKTITKQWKNASIVCHIIN